MGEDKTATDRIEFIDGDVREITYTEKLELSQFDKGPLIRYITAGDEVVVVSLLTAKTIELVNP